MKSRKLKPVAPDTPDADDHAKIHAKIQRVLADEIIKIIKNKYEVMTHCHSSSVKIMFS